MGRHTQVIVGDLERRPLVMEDQGYRRTLHGRSGFSGESVFPHRVGRAGIIGIEVDANETSAGLKMPGDCLAHFNQLLLRLGII